MRTPVFAPQVHIQPFRDMIDGMRMDLVKSRYRSYDELYGYCYKVAGTVALMTTPVMGIDPDYTVRPTTGFRPNPIPLALLLPAMDRGSLSVVGFAALG